MPPLSDQTHSTVHADNALLDSLASNATEELATAIAHLKESLTAHRRHRAWIFDFDGTLVDSEPLNVATAQAVLRGCGLQADADWLTAGPFTPASMLRTRVLDHYKIDLPWSDERLLKEGGAFWLAHTHQLQPVRYVAALARAAKAKGLPVAVASANHSGFIRAGLTATALNDVFDIVVGQDQVPHTKPAPDVFLHAARLLNLDPAACLAYENTDPGIAAATAAGMDVVDIRTWAHPTRPTSS
ncbi:HAD family hydrolase [Streptomyces alfalfae]|uniref:HAD family phosphatase n=1 Tax=Streptomyces alfalfae TaxID=1642299 RepID=A0ABN4VHZ1_9ACTN|nr:HAD family phosphatase [Streptomyces alfalfae]APY85527.1 hypothetical protein A7J05_07185 [Streptomyces alfalfae]